MTLEDVKNALLSVTDNVRHFGYLNPPDTYIVYAEDTQPDALSGGGKMRIQMLEGTIDLYTKDLDAGYPKLVQDALLTAGIPFRLNSIQYELKSQTLHNEWVFRIKSYL